jgi:hypothetical protein
MTASPLPLHRTLLSKRTWQSWLGCALLGFAAVGYFIQCFTPLRLTGDVIKYLSMASSAGRGLGFTRQGESAGYPPGYPALIWALERMGLSSPFFLNLLNLAALAGAMLALASIARTRRMSGTAMSAIIACLFSYVVVKHAALQLTDTAFLCVTTVSIAMAELATESKGRRAGAFWTCAFLSAALGIALRTAGLVTVPVLLFECWRTEFRSHRLIAWKSAILFGLVLVAFAGAGFRWTFSREMGHEGTAIPEHVKALTRRPFVDLVGAHLVEFGALGLNVPPSKLPPGVTPLFYAAGFSLAGLAGLGLVRSRRQWTVGKTFLVCYSLVVLLWPENVDPRFWLPVIPLLALEVLTAVKPITGASSPGIRFIAWSYAVCFVLAGAIAIGYSIRLTVSRQAFLDAPANKHWKPTYEAWMRAGRAPNSSGIDPEVFSLLREFGGDR